MEDKSIAYEMAMLVKENRELRDKIAHLQNAYDELKVELNQCYDRERNKVREEKSRSLAGTAEDARCDDYVVISECLGKKPKYDKGFLIRVGHIYNGDDGLKTLYGTCMFRDEVEGAVRKFMPVKVNNKSYGWKRVMNENMSTIVKKLGKSSDRPSNWSYVKGKAVDWHLECENLIKI